MFSKELRPALRKMINSIPDVPPERHTDELLEIYAPFFKFMTRADVIYFRKLVEKKLPHTNLLTLVDGHIALRDIIGDLGPKDPKKPKKKKK